nr:hypothetical protein [Tanacetum cinerariifolium]
HALVADEEAPTEFALMANTSTESKKDLSWTGLLECADDTVTDYSRPSPTVESSSEEDQNRNPSASENVTSPITPKQFVKFVKASDRQSKRYVSLGKEDARLPEKELSKLHNMYSIDLNNIVPHRDLTCLVAKASADECNLWHRWLGKFEAKGDEGYFIGYSMSSKAFKVFNKRTRRVEENLHVEFLENKAIKKCVGPNWLFDIDSLTKSMNYVPVDAGTNSTNFSGTKDVANQEVLKNKKDERGIVVKNKARLVAQGHTQVEGIDYDELFAPVARIDAIRLFLAYASFLGFTDPEFLAKVYKVEKAMYGLHQAPRAWYVLQKEDGIFISQDKYIGDILKKFKYSNVRSSNTPMDKENPWGKDGTGKDIDIHLYRSMIGSLMYLIASRPDIMFAVCACARHQVTPKECHLHAVKRIFRYLKGHPKLGLWYPKASPFDLVAYSDSDYGSASQDRKSTTGRTASCCGQVLWIQNQLLDYG